MLTGLDDQNPKSRKRWVGRTYQNLPDALEDQKQLFVDESPTKQGKLKAWLWVAVAPAFTVFAIFGNRSRDSLKSLIGDYSGMVINCDRAKMYLDGEQLQWCWAHIKRDIQKLIDSQDSQAKRLGHDLMRQQQLLFEYWHSYKEGKLSWRSFKQELNRSARNSMGCCCAECSVETKS